MKCFFVLCVSLSAACMTHETRDWQAQREAERARRTAVEEKERKERNTFQEANKLVVEEDKWLVREVRVSHLLAPTTQVESGGNPALGTVAGGGTAALLGFGPVGIVAGATIGTVLGDEPIKQVVTTDLATCVIVGEKPPTIKTFLFDKKNHPEWIGTCLTSRPGDTVVFVTTTRREWYYDSSQEKQGSPDVFRTLVLSAKPK